MNNKIENLEHNDIYCYIEILQDNKIVSKNHMIECPICLEEIYINKQIKKYNCCFPIYSTKKEKNIKPICILSCSHLYHSLCIYDWLQKEKTCPLCRTELKKFF